MSQSNFPVMEGPCCPIPIRQREMIVIGHGSGGQLTHDLIREVFQSRLGNPLLNEGNDSALLDSVKTIPAGQRLVLSTDAHIVSPIFFPGGDIGRLSVCGTVNDLAMMGAEPKYLTATFILEEGFPTADLERVVNSMAVALKEADVLLVAADTKVTERGKSDGIFISTTGLGFAAENRRIAGDQARPGDAILISGPIGNHGIAIAQARGNLGFQSDIRSDTAPLNHLVKRLLAEIPEVHVLRDPTRGGLATTLVEICHQSSVSMELIEAAIPIDQPVRVACELLGLDSLYLANEGKMLMIMPAEYAGAALELLRASEISSQAAIIGQVSEAPGAQLVLKTSFGTTRVLDRLSGEMLPRIC